VRAVSLRRLTRQCAQAYNDVAHFETPYVVKLHRVAPLAPAQPVFVFEHPNTAAEIDNSRYAQFRLCCYVESR
jgi:hypothetical protein